MEEDNTINLVEIGDSIGLTPSEMMMIVDVVKGMTKHCRDCWVKYPSVLYYLRGQSKKWAYVPYKFDVGGDEDRTISFTCQKFLKDTRERVLYDVTAILPSDLIPIDEKFYASSCLSQQTIRSVAENLEKAPPLKEQPNLPLNDMPLAFATICVDCEKNVCHTHCKKE